MRALVLLLASCASLPDEFSVGYERGWGELDGIGALDFDDNWDAASVGLTWYLGSESAATLPPPPDRLPGITAPPEPQPAPEESGLMDWRYQLGAAVSALLLAVAGWFKREALVGAFKKEKTE